MNAHPGPNELATAADQFASSAADEPMSTFKLKRTGRRAVRFDGWQLVEAFCSSQGKDVWHDLNLYRTERTQIVVELIARTSLADHQEVCQVHTFETLTAAAIWLEAYNAADDAPIPLSLSQSGTALPWAMLQAVHLRHNIERIVADYRSMLSDVFMALDLFGTEETALFNGGVTSDAQHEN